MKKIRRVSETNKKFISIAFASALLLSALLTTQFNSSLVTEASGTVYLTKVGDFLKFGNEYLEFTFDLSKKGALYSFYNKLTRQELIQNKSSVGSVWLVYTLEEMWFSGDEMNNFYWSNVGDESNMTLILFWQNLQYNGIHLLNVTAAINVQSGSPLTSWKIQLENKDPDISLHSIFFPFIHGITYLGDSPEKDRFVTPFFEGLLIPEPYNLPEDWNYYMTYPGAGHSMQFILFYEEDLGGYYFATHDPENDYKEVEFMHEYGRTFKFDFRNFAAGIQPGNSYYQPYPIILGVFAGKDWIDGARIYKEWATQQWWCKKGKIAQRADIPEWWKNTVFSLWFQSYHTDPNTGEIILTHNNTVYKMGECAKEMRKFLPEGHILMEWAGWNKGGYDRLYPEFFPPRDGEDALKTGIQGAHEYNVSIELHFNGIIIDTATETYQESKEYILLDEKGQPYMEYWAHGYSANVVVCPYTQFWKELLINVTVTGVRDYGVDVVYLDEMSDDMRPCFNPAHGHPIGGGNWWATACSNILEAVRTEIRKYNPQAIVTSEGVMEFFIPSTDGFRTHELIRQYEDDTIVQANGMSIPLFSYIYHEYSMIYGFDCTPYHFAHTAYWMVAQRVLRGSVPGVWPNSLAELCEPYSDLNLINYMVNLGKARTTYARPYLVEGEIVDVVDVPAIQTEYPPPFWSSRVINASTVYEYVYKGSDGKIGIFTANVAEVNQTVPIEIDFKRLSLDPTRTYPLYDLTNGTVIGEISRTKNTITLNIPARGLSALGFIPKYFTGDLNEDGKVNILDIFIVAQAFGSKPGDTNWNVVADIDKNGIIDILDIFAVAREYGRTI
jgi:hypothetical protein